LWSPGRSHTTTTPYHHPHPTPSCHTTTHHPLPAPMDTGPGNVQPLSHTHLHTPATHTTPHYHLCTPHPPPPHTFLPTTHRDSLTCTATPYTTAHTTPCLPHVPHHCHYTHTTFTTTHTTAHTAPHHTTHIFAPQPPYYTAHYTHTHTTLLQAPHLPHTHLPLSTCFYIWTTTSTGLSCTGILPHCIHPHTHHLAAWDLTCSHCLLHSTTSHLHLGFPAPCT